MKTKNIILEKGETTINTDFRTLNELTDAISLGLSEHLKHNIPLFYASLKKKDLNKILKAMKKNSLSVYFNYFENMVIFNDFFKCELIFITTFKNFMDGKHEY